ncbi:LOW QUALITY PROTEIN: uncharacterized protein LOC117642960 [Thrips palmi]|uniref:LOW QUALITY PROTEIN: uncharacterized protein LOC117642960 n=1 Tax=Thrips palmi TaxID=161013 RepID=A0A6P8YCU3_THRPL|nr:LOW QUALITY PROTEIN: uncharacterized protein LOC117642960 [Thrips palmi]
MQRMAELQQKRNGLMYMTAMALALALHPKTEGTVKGPRALLGATVEAVEAVADKRADAEADASADPGTGSSFFDTFMAFLGSSALHRQQPEDGAERAAARDAVEGAASDTSAQQQPPAQFQGRDLQGLQGQDQFLAGAPPQDGGQADRVKRTGALPAHLLGSVINHKLGYLGAKSSHHVHFHNYNTKCDKAHFSLWEFKKGILHKLLEAAKAIGGGVLALKGKLITAKGHLVAAKGRKLASKGEELTEFGKSVLAKALGHGGHDEVHTVASAPSGPANAHFTAPVYGAPVSGPALGYQYGAPQYLPPAPSGHGYNSAVSLLNEYSRAGFGHAAGPLAHGLGAMAAASSHGHASVHAGHAGHSGHHPVHRAGQAPTGPSATGSAGTLPGSLQAGLLVLQPAPSASGSHRAGSLGAASSQHAAAVPAPTMTVADAAATPSAPYPSETLAIFASQPNAASQPLVLAPEYMDAMAPSETNKVRRYAVPTSSRRSLDAAMAAVVRGLQGSDLLLHPDIVRNAAQGLAVTP